MKISLVIPTLNESASIGELLRSLSGVFSTLPQYNFEVIIVDDGSSDGTVEAAWQAGLPHRQAGMSFPLKIIERKERGLATAVLAGFAAAEGEILGVMDADLSHPPEMIPALISALESADIAIGSRHLPGGIVEEWPRYRYIISALATLLARPLARSVRDPLSGFFFLRRSVLEEVKFSPLGYKILLEILVKGRYQRVKEIPYTFKNRGRGKSKMGLREGVNFLRHLGRLYWRKIAR